MWIRFKSKQRYAIKIYVGGVNAVSGEPVLQTEAVAQCRRREKIRLGQSLQDYVVVPQQPWLDGIATAAGEVRQFVAMPMGSGYSVEAQVTGEEAVGGIQFEITPLCTTLVLVNTWNNTIIESLQLQPTWTVRDLKTELLSRVPRFRESSPFDFDVFFDSQQLEGMD